MVVTLKPVSEQVIVITGATSGIGLATALDAVRRGAKVVLAARNAEALAEVERRIATEGGLATHVPADVSNRADVRRIADAAVSRFGGFDTWVNNAGVTLFGRIQEVSEEDHRRLFETNYWGLVYGSLVAVEHLERKGGALINLGSVVSDVPVPIQGLYSVTKHAVRGFTDALRMELEEKGAPVSVSLIKPTSINTPLPQNARNYTSREPRLPDPAYQPEEVADAILYAAANPVRDLFVGGSARLMSALRRAAPRTMDWVGEHVLARQQGRDEPPRNPEGNLYRPSRGGQVHGEHPGYVAKTSLYTRAMTNPGLSGLLLGLAGGVALGVRTTGRSGR